MDCGFVAVDDEGSTLNGDPVTRPRFPLVGSIRYAEMSPESRLAAYRRGAFGAITMAIGVVPVLKILGGVTGGSALLVGGTTSSPFPVLILSRVMLAPAELAM